MGLTPIDVALLLAEWATAPTDGRPSTAPPASWHCPTCGGTYPRHAPNCAHDEALGERGYPTRTERDETRELILRSRAHTLPPPGEEPPTRP